MALTIDTATTVEDFKVLFHRSEAKTTQLEKLLNTLRHDTDVAVTKLNVDLSKSRAETASARREDRIDLIDMKMISPTAFDGTKLDAFKPWTKRLKAFCNAKVPGFRQALEAAEKSDVEINDAAIARLGWEPAIPADKKLFDLLGLICTGEALTIVERHPDHGFEAFRQLNKRFNPIGETYSFDKLTALMHQPRCKNMAELPGAVEKWEDDVRRYEDRSNEMFPESMKMPILMQMVPAKDLEQVLYRFRMNPEKDYANFSRQLVEFGTQRRYEAMRGSGAVPMDLDAADAEAAHKQGAGYVPLGEYTADQWRDWYANGMPGEPEEQDQSADWLSKGKGKGKKGKGKGKGADPNCLWCGKGGHYKKDCRDFQKWKDDKDAERAKAGLPPYVAPNRSSPGKGQPLRSLDHSEPQQVEYVPIGGMTMDNDSLEEELSPLDGDDEVAYEGVNIGFIPYHGPNSVIDSDCTDALDDADLRQYWEM